MTRQLNERDTIDLSRFTWLVPVFWLASLAVTGVQAVSYRTTSGVASPVSATLGALAPARATNSIDTAGPSLFAPSRTTTSTWTPTETISPSPRPTAHVAFVDATRVDLPIPPPAQIGSCSGLQIHVIDVGQGSASLIIGPNRETALIDGGTQGSGVVGYLQSVGVDRLDLVVATHPHADHIGGLIDVLQVLPVSMVATNGRMHTTLTYEHFLDAVLNTSADYTEVVRGDRLTIGGLVFEVLNPTSSVSGDLNSDSMVLRLATNGMTLLIMGDAGQEVEGELLRSGLDLAADVLVVGHHGSQDASSLPFLEQVRPKVAIYSAGAGNSYGHPAPQTLDNLVFVGATVYGTDTSGSVVVECDLQGLVVHTSRGSN